MVAIGKRPQGYKIIDQGISATVTTIGDGDAIVNFTAHGLVTGDVVYVESDIEDYNGFWYVTLINANSFKISDWSDDQVDYFQDADITYYQTQPHDWSSIFLPMVYKATNDRWPTNTVDPAILVISHADDNGFTTLILSGSLTASVNALEFVEISNSLQSGVYQIVEVVSPTEIVINLAYTSTDDLPGATINYYYNNYQVRIKIYAGLPASHPWEPKKPFTEVAELSLTPDENNEVMFSVSDYITQKVAIKNNTLLFSLPLNLDAFTGFFISTGESFDQSDNYSLYTSESDFTDDTFTGYAVAGKLPFKNMYSGDYADYVYTSGSPALWLTILDRLLAVDGLYFDVSFIKNVVGTFNLIIDKYITSDYSVPQIILFEDQGIGVYRLPLTIDANYESYCIRVETNSHEEEVEVPPTPFDLSAFQNDPSASDPWTTGSTPFILNSHNSRVLYISYPTTMSVPYRFNYKFRAENVIPGTKIFSIATLDAIIGGITFEHIPVTSNGIYEGYVTLTPSANGLYVGVTNSSSLVAFDLYLLEFSEGEATTETVEIPGATITEEICIDIIDDCQAADQFVADNIRELEDGNYRLLE